MYPPIVNIPTILDSVWNHSVVRFARSVFKDLVRFVIILLSLEVFWMILRRMELSGYPSDQLDYFEKVHFCTSLIAFVMFSLVFLIKLAAGLYRQGE
jgi:hypothetical protein